MHTATCYLTVATSYISFAKLQVRQYNNYTVWMATIQGAASIRNTVLVSQATPFNLQSSFSWRLKGVACETNTIQTRGGGSCN